MTDQFSHTDPTIQALEGKLVEIRSSILRLEGEAHAVEQVLTMLHNGVPTPRTTVALGEPRPAFEEAPQNGKGRRKGGKSPNQGRPWRQPGNADYWRRKAGQKYVDQVRDLLRGETEGITQQAIAQILDLNTAIVSRSIIALWKYGELEFLGRSQGGSGKGHRTTNVWRLWTGTGSPPDPEARWDMRL